MSSCGSNSPHFFLFLVLNGQSDRVCHPTREIITLINRLAHRIVINHHNPAIYTPALLWTLQCAWSGEAPASHFLHELVQTAESSRAFTLRALCSTHIALTSQQILWWNQWGTRSLEKFTFSLIFSFSASVEPKCQICWFSKKLQVRKLKRFINFRSNSACLANEKAFWVCNWHLK